MTMMPVSKASVPFIRTTTETGLGVQRLRLVPREVMLHLEAIATITIAVSNPLKHGTKTKTEMAVELALGHQLVQHQAVITSIKVETNVIPLLAFIW